MRMLSPAETCRKLRLACLFVTGLTVAFPAAAEVRWKTGPPRSARALDSAGLAEAIGRLAQRPDARHVVVQFAEPLSVKDRTLLDDRGLSLLGYLGDHAWFASLGPDADVAALASTPGLLDVGSVEPERKLHPDLEAGLIHPWQIVIEDAKSPEKAQPAPDDAPVAVYVLFHADVDLDTRASVVLARHRAKVRSWMRSIRGAVVHVDRATIPAIAAEDDVLWIEPPLPGWRELNDGNRARVGADVAQLPPYALDGTGVTVLVYDGGQMFQHGDFGGRLVIGASDTSSISDHATHVGGTIGGDGSGSDGTYRGMAPGVGFVSYGFEQEGGIQQGFLYTDPGDLEADYTEAISVYGADISNNSIGTNTASNGFPCEWEGNYGATGALIDAVARGSLGAPFRIVWANGNERSGFARCGSTYHTTAPPACAKNHITVGALNSNDDSVTSFTSWGPCDDGRLKPDVSAPGCQSGGDNGVTSTNSAGSYNVKCGTSMASPTTCGVGALVLEQYRLSFPGAPNLRNATLKAILANTAEDLDNPGPDFKTGYGSIRVVAAIDLVREARLLEGEVAHAGVFEFLVLIEPGDPELRVTIAWDDAPGTPNVDPVLVNDLDLRVIDPLGTVYHPWTLDPVNPSVPAVRTQRDGVNNIEQVLVEAPAPGAWRVEVAGFDVPQGPVQSFGAAASPSLVHCSPAGVLRAGATRVSCESSLELRVTDCDLNTDDEIVETVDISAVSDTEPAGEILTLMEASPEAAAFDGVLSMSATDAMGTLAVSDGDTVTVTYVDADDGAGGTDIPRVRQVTVDCVAPQISAVDAVLVNPRDATISLDLDEPAQVTVRWGTTCATATNPVITYADGNPHLVRLTGLTDDVTYFYTIEAVDEAGNTAFDDNSGICYTFTTPDVPDYFTERFTSGPVDLIGRSVTFTPNGSPDFYGGCVETLLGGALPTDPAGGTDLLLGDDLPRAFTLAGGATVELYGQSWDTIYAGPNGYLTFGSGDSTKSESYGAHFSLPRVAAVFDDLNPNVQGTVSWKQEADRVAVTWSDVPEFSTTNHNTFQIEMFFDGRIRMSWLELDTDDFVVGLSEGTGLDPFFLASDLSAMVSCGPRPPLVRDLDLETAQGQPLTVTFDAVDDGLPEPSELTYRILSLPLSGELVEQQSQILINQVPWDLSPGEDGVTYTPVGGFQGFDGLSYEADDGGVPPDGGPSGPAAVTIRVGNAQTLYEFLFDDTDPGWATTGLWAFGTPTGGGSHAGDPTSGATGQNVYGYNLDGDYTSNMPEEYLTTPPLDLSSASECVLEFQRWLGIETAAYDHAAVQISVDGTNWTPVWTHSGTSFSENAWSLQSYDISAIADGQSSVSFRWVMGTTDVSVTYPGWNLDDIRITGLIPDTCMGSPGEVELSMPDRERLTWTLPPMSGGGPPAYDTLRSTTATSFLGALCVESDDASDRSATDLDTPAPAEVWFYLVRASNECGVGSLGLSSAMQPRVGPDCVAP